MKPLRRASVPASRNPPPGNGAAPRRHHLAPRRRVDPGADAAPPRRLHRAAEERFITDRHLGFTRRKEGGAFTYQVEHAPWRLYRGDAATLDADVGTLFGPEFMEALCFPPRLALTADGSSVIVRQRRRLQ